MSQTSMRIAIVSDIHGNLTAFESIIADLQQVRPDLVLFAGDLTGLPRPAEVIDHIRYLGWPGVMGNADEALWNLDSAPLPSDLMEQIKPQFDVLRDLLGDERISWL